MMRDYWSAEWTQVWEKYQGELRDVALELSRLPHWRWIKRGLLRERYRDLQLLISYTCDYANEEARDRLLLQSLK